MEKMEITKGFRVCGHGGLVGRLRMEKKMETTIGFRV